MPWVDGHGELIEHCGKNHVRQDGEDALQRVLPLICAGHADDGFRGLFANLPGGVVVSQFWHCSVGQALGGVDKGAEETEEAVVVPDAGKISGDQMTGRHFPYCAKRPSAVFAGSAEHRPVKSEKDPKHLWCASTRSLAVMAFAKL